MVKFLHVWGDPLNGSALSAGGTYYIPLSGQGAQGNEVMAQLKVVGGATQANLAAYIQSNATTANSTIAARNNGSSSTNVAITLGAGTTGLVTDLTGSEAWSDGALLTTRFAVGTGGNINVRFISTTLDSDYCHNIAAETNRQIAAGATVYWPIRGSMQSYQTTEAGQKMYRSGTFAYFRVRVQTNNSNGAGTFRFRKNGADGNQVVSYSASETGAKEDTSNTDTVASGDIVNYSGNNAGSTGIYVLPFAQSRLSASGYGMLVGANLSSLSSNQTRYGSFDGHFVDATEAYVRTPVLADMTLLNLRGYLTSNTINGTTTITLRENGADNTTLQIQWSSSTTGAQEDITGNVALVSTDECNWSIVTAGSSGSASLRFVQVEQAQVNETPTISPNTADASTLYIRPTLEFTGSDTEDDDLRYNIQITDNPDAWATEIMQEFSSGSIGTVIHPNPITGETTWEDEIQVDDRVGQTIQAKGGILDSIDFDFGPDTDTDGSYKCRVYSVGGGLNVDPVPAIWAASTAYSAGDVIRPTSTANANVHFFYRCKTSGMSGGSEPSWPGNGVLWTTITDGQEVTDNTVTWEAKPGPYPLDPAAPGDTPTPGWLAVSDEYVFDTGGSGGWHTMEFSGANRIRLTAGQWYMFILDWLPNDEIYDNTITVSTRNEGDADGPGGLYLDSSATTNNGPRVIGDAIYRMREEFVLLDKTSGTDSGFVNTVTPADTDPFNAGEKVSFTIQTANELDAGITYYWRVRVVDPNGSNTWSSWTTTRSFTTASAHAYGEENPTNGETAISWATWSDGAGGAPTISGDADWGKLQLAPGEEAFGAVYDLGDSNSRQYTINRDTYGTGGSPVILYIRGNTTSFGQDDATPTWDLYESPVTKAWRYVQIKAVAPIRLSLLEVSGTNARYFADANGNPVFLAGFHTWYDVQDGSDTDPPTAFDWDEYIDALVSYGCNATKLWANETVRGWGGGFPDQWIYPGRYERTGPGNAADGHPKFDLTQVNEEYLTRLRDRAIQCGQLGIYCIVQLFQGWQIENKGSTGDPFTYHPYEAANNVNSVDGDDDNDGEGLETHWPVAQGNNVLSYQEDLIDAIISTLADLNNIIWEISNEDEDDASGYNTAWQEAMIDYLQANDAKGRLVGMTKQYPNGEDTTLDGSGAAWVSYSTSKADAVHSASDPISIYDTDHTVGITTDYSWIWEALCNGHGGLLFMDKWYPNMYEEDKRNSAAEILIRENLGYALAMANSCNNLLAMTPQPSLSTTNLCLARDHATAAEYIVSQGGSGAFNLDLTTATGTLNIFWRRCSDGSTDTGTVSGGAVRTLTPPWTGEVACRVYH